ncbi:Cpe/LpqF family protein [uncultured Microbacterium sp.]|uniref:Cpe/LpqF family protein n=1 Tax=uncultured Microbacterium sp. TaxID=191216 RepID=UPI0026074B50|nr:Cpe/LpqF family protein [uncultured Microbacterium sp.]
MRKKTIIAIIAVAGLLLTACAAKSEAPEDSDSTSIPSTPVGDAAQWVLDEMNADDDTTATAWESRLSAQFQAEVGAEDVASLINTQIRPARPLEVTAYRGTETEAVVTVAGALGEPFDLSISIDDDQLIGGLFLGPVTPQRTPAVSNDDVAERLGALPLTARVLVQIDDETIMSIDEKAPAPLGSVFKLYVLEALAEAVSAGDISWNDNITVTDAVRSLPSGDLQNLPDGTDVTVQDAATKMIAISDNTATDMLVELLGREAVEHAVEAGNHHEPELMHPFLTTREMFDLVWGGHVDLQDAWADGDESVRREVLEVLRTREFQIDVDDIDERVAWQYGLEWFASAQDIAELHAILAQHGDADPVIRTALSENPGVVVDPAAWPSVSYKGGSNLGVITGSWRAVRADGSIMTVVVLGSDAEPIDAETEAELFAIASDLFAINAG